MQLPDFLHIVEIFLFIFMPACSFILIPITYKSYLKWRETKKPRYFSATVIQGGLALCFLISIFPLFATRIVELYSLSKGTIYGLLGCLALGCIFGYCTIPKMLSYYQKLKLERTPAYFSLMVIFGAISLYCILPIFIIFLHSTFVYTY